MASPTEPHTAAPTLAPAAVRAGPVAGAPPGAALARAPALRAAALRRRDKAHAADEAERLEQLPNIGPSIAADLRSIGVTHPRDLTQRDPFELYQALARASGRRQDPCVLDTFMAATDFMRGAAARPWWSYTAERKRRFGIV
jgi:predicted flap endonuclease-1-like 5' DNA nuclease